MKPLDAAIGVIALCAVVMTALAVRREVGTSPQKERVRRPIRLAAGDTVQAVGSTIGNASAAVKIVEFSDFECPYCAQAQDALKGVLDRHPGQVSIVFRHLPLHKNSRAAAVAAECAGVQGRFADYHDVLFAQQSRIGAVAWDDFASQANVPDLPAFRSCVRSSKFDAKITADSVAALRIRVPGTPTFVIGQDVVAGVPSAAELDRYVASALEHARVAR